VVVVEMLVVVMPVGVGNEPPILPLAKGVDRVFGVFEGTEIGELVLTGGFATVVVEGGIIELVDVILILDPDGGREPCRVQFLTSHMASLPMSSFIGVKVRTQVITNVPRGELAVVTIVAIELLAWRA